METLEDKIKKFLAVGYGSGYGYGDGSGYDHGNGSGHGSGYGYRDGYRHDLSSGDGSGPGDGSGYSSGYGDGSGYGSSYHSGHGSGDGTGYGYGDGCGDGVKMTQGHKVYLVDGTQTVITSVRDNIAQGFILQSDLQLKPCFIVKENNKFTHGDTLREAFVSLQEKLYDNSTEEERIGAFKQKFPLYDTKYDNQDLFAYHHVLTGSCRMGRESFITDKGLSLDGRMSIREFVELTKDAYGGGIIKQLPQAYGITE